MNWFKKRQSKNRPEMSEAEKVRYTSYLQIIALVSILTGFIEAIAETFEFMSHGKSLLQIVIAVISVSLLFIFAAIGFMLASETRVHPDFDQIINGLRKDTAVTILFFTHIILVTLFIAQDGGSKSSSLSSILLLDAGFGFVFAQKKHTKKLVTLFCTLCYFVTFLFYVEKSLQCKFTWELIPHLLSAFFVILVNEIISRKTSEEATSPLQAERKPTDSMA